jgi:polyphosphate kinase 2 (PPK2 family)
MIVDGPWLVSPGVILTLNGRPTEPPERLKKSDAKPKFEVHVDGADVLEEGIFAKDRQARLLLFQAMDAASQDGTLRVAVAEVVAQTLERINPTVPSPEDIDWAGAHRRLSS